MRGRCADVRDAAQLRQAIGDEEFDAVVNWVGYVPDDVRDHPRLFTGRAGQYVFISTTSVYARPVPQLPVTESRRGLASVDLHDHSAMYCMVQISHRLSMYKCATGSSAANWTGWIDEVVNIITVAVQLIPQSGTGQARTS